MFSLILFIILSFHSITAQTTQISPIIIPVGVPINENSAEISGLALYNDYLILLPQYPDFATKDGNAYLYTIHKSDLIESITSKNNTPLQPVPIPFISPDFNKMISGFEGFEAICFNGNDVYLTIESETRRGMKGYLVSGIIATDLSAITMNSVPITEIVPQSRIGNMCEESIICWNNRLITIYEANGAAVNPSPKAHIFTTDLNPEKPLPLDPIEYRITDATNIDDHNRFWAINYFYPGDKELLPTVDPIMEKFFPTNTPPIGDPVERLVEFEISEKGIKLTDTPPIIIKQIPGYSRNWEGIVRLDDLGFLIVTDKFPETVLAFVPYQK